MLLLWSGFVGLFTLRLIKRHGWEYVPIILIAFGAWWHFGSHTPGGLGDALMLTAITGIHLVTRKDVLADRSMVEL